MLRTRQPNEPLGVSSSTRVAAVHSAQVSTYQIPFDDHVPARAAAQAVLVTMPELWIEEVLPGHPSWIIASRVIGDDRGVPVIAEIRIFPNLPIDDPHRSQGEWAASALGCRARPIPQGGISATMLRRSAAQTIGHHAKVAGSLRWSPIERLSRARGMTAHTTEAAARLANAMHSAGINTDHDPFAKLRSRRKASKQGRGRPAKWTPLDFARIALTYDDAIRDGTAPIQAVMKAHSMKHAQARNLIARARKTGFLRDAPKQGRAAEGLSEAERKRLRQLIASMKRGSKGRTR